MQVVLYAKTDQWYVQPFTDAPFTKIADDGTWANGTHPWSRIVALLVDESYRPTNTSVRHPASAFGVVAWDEYPEKKGETTVRFADLDWVVKVGTRAGPGPNDFSDDPDNVWVDREGLHLRITERDGRWQAAEVFLPGSLGYGIYEFVVASPVDALDRNAVFSGFVYESAQREIDVEFSSLLARPDNAQYVVQPYTEPDHLRTFAMPGATVSTHRFEWRADRISFASWTGDEPRDDATIAEWTFAGQIPPPGGEAMHFNLWLFDGNPPAAGHGDHVVVRAFRYLP
jgi:hypothetical protein